MENLAVHIYIFFKYKNIEIDHRISVRNTIKSTQ